MTQHLQRPQGGEAAAVRLELVLVALVSLHSVAVGVLLLFFPDWSARFGGFEPIRPVFFARQGGVFHVVLGIAYLAQYARTGSVSLLLFAKASATVFLVSVTLAGGVPWAVPASAAGDALMGLLAFWISRRTSSLGARR